MFLQPNYSQQTNNTQWDPTTKHVFLFTGWRGGVYTKMQAYLGTFLFSEKISNALSTLTRLKVLLMHAYCMYTVEEQECIITFTWTTMKLCSKPQKIRTKKFPNSLSLRAFVQLLKIQHTTSKIQIIWGRKLHQIHMISNMSI